MTPVVLQANGLVLDQPTEADIDAIARYCADPLFEQYLTTPWPYERRHAEGFVRELFAGNTASAATARSAGVAFTGVGPSHLADRAGSYPQGWHGLLRRDEDPVAARASWAVLPAISTEALR